MGEVTGCTSIIRTLVQMPKMSNLRGEASEFLRMSICALDRGTEGQDGCQQAGAAGDVHLHDGGDGESKEWHRRSTPISLIEND